jgi:type I restriction enzyme S subunit
VSIPVPLPSPVEWQRIPAGRLFARERRVARPEDDVVTAFRDGQVTARANRRTEGFTNAVQEIGYQGVRRGDLVIHSMDGFAGAIGVSDSDGKASPVVHAYAARDNADARFFAYMLRTLAREGFVTSLAKGIRERSTAFDSATFTSLAMPTPPLHVQRATADYLDHETARIDAVIAAKRRMVELLEERLQGAISESTHTRIVVDSDHRLPDGWRLMPLRRCLGAADYGIGESSHPEGEYAVLGMTNISSGEVVGVPGGYVSVVDQRLLLSPGDLLFNRTNSRELVGKVGLVKAIDRPTTFASYLVRLRVNNMADSDYFNYLLNAREVLRLARSMALPSIGQANLNPSRYSTMVLPVPPVDEQRRLVSHLDVLASRAGRMRQTIDHQISLLEERRQAVIIAALTGQLRIPEGA